MAGLGSRPWVAIVFFADGLAGCAGDPADEGLVAATGADAIGGPKAGANASFVTELERTLNATLNATAMTTKDWILVSMLAGPERPLAAFEWTVPRGAVVPGRDDPADRLIVLEIIHVLPEGASAAVVQTILSAFHVVDGKAVHLGAYANGAWDEVWRTGPLVETYRYEGIQPEGSYYWLSWGELESGDTVYFVLGAEAAQPMELGMAFRVLDHEPDWGPEVPAKDLPAFRANTTGQPPKALKRLGTGTGFSFPVYLDLRYLVLGYEGWTKDVRWMDGLALNPRPWATARDLTMEYELASERGWTEGFGIFYSDGGGGSWDAQVSAHGPTKILAGRAYPGILGFVNEEYWNGAGYGVYAEGAGDSRARFHVTVADGSDYNIVVMYHLDFGETLENLIGTPAFVESYVFDPHQDWEVHARVQGPDVLVQFGDASLRLPNLGTAVRAAAPPSD